jgi:hypothetical protein
MKNLWLSIKDLFSPKQRWLTKKIPNHWMDKPELIQLVLFETLIDYVENEEGLKDQFDFSEDLQAGYIDQKYIDNVKAVDGELRRVYNYIKNERQTLEENWDSYKDLQELERRDLEAMTTIVKYSGYLWT